MHTCRATSVSCKVTSISLRTVCSAAFSRRSRLTSFSSSPWHKPSHQLQEFGKCQRAERMCVSGKSMLASLCRHKAHLHNMVKIAAEQPQLGH